MSGDVASLQFKADTSSIKQAATDLDKMTDSASKAEGAAENLSDALSDAGKGASSIAPNAEKGAKAVDKLSQSAKKAEISAGQMRAGWTNATNQFIDIGVTLQGGMSPITVMTQQLPQLAMSFGSLGNTLAAFAPLINPVTLGITAIGAGLAYLSYQVYDSYKQTDLLNQALAKTGYQAGTTADALKGVAADLAQSTGASKDNAQLAVTAAAALATTTAQLREYASAALVVSQQTGESVEDLVKQFAKLSGDPLNALEQLGTQFGILNPILYDQVKAMSDAGDKAGAYQLVLDSVQKHMNDFKNDQKNQLGDVQDEWDIVIGKVKTYLTEASKQPDIPKFEAPKTGSVWLDAANESADAAAKAQQKVADANFKTITEMAQGTATVIDGIKKRNTAAANAAIDTSAKLEQYQLRSSKIQKEMEITERNIITLRSGGTEKQKKDAADLLALQQKQYDQALKAEAKRDAPAKKKAVTVDAGDKLTEQYQAQNIALDAQIQLLQQRTTGELNASSQRKAYMELEAKYDVLSQAASERKLTTQEQQMLAVKDEALAQAKILADKGDQLALLQRQAQISDEIASKTAANTEAAKAEADYAGQSSREMARKVRDAEEYAKLAEKGATAAQQQANAAANAIKDQSEDAQRGDWINASKTALADWADDATNYAAIAKDAITGAMDAGTEAISDFVLTGKLDFADFTKTILKMIVDIITKMLVMKAIEATIGAFSGGGVTANAKGGVYSDPSLHQYVNGVYDTPQMFQFGGRSQFANGGVFAEAGPEAIMPLTRDSNGRLGIKAEGGGGGGSVSVQTNVYIDSNGNATSNTTASDATGRAIGDQINNVINTQIQKMMQPNGQIYNFVRG